MPARWIGPLLLLLMAGCATPAPPEALQGPGPRPPTDPRYVELLDQARRSGPAITVAQMVALRWAWVNSTDFDPVMPTRLTLAITARFPPDGNCATAKAAASEVLAIHWLDLRAHALKLACARRESDQAAEALHLAVRDAILGAMRATGDGSGPSSAMTVISVDEEYALLEILGARRTAIRVERQPGGTFDVMQAASRDGGRQFTLWFRVDDIFAFYRRRPGGDALRQG